MHPVREKATLHFLSSSSYTILSVHSSFKATVHLPLSGELLFNYRGITKRQGVHFNNRILPKVRSLAAPITCKNLLLYRAATRGHSFTRSLVKSQSTVHIKAGREDGTVQEERNNIRSVQHLIGVRLFILLFPVIHWSIHFLAGWVPG